MVSTSLALEELSVVRHVVDAREDLLKVSETELLLFEVKQHRKVVFCHRTVSVSLAELSHQLAEVCIRWKLGKNALLFLALLTVQAQETLLERLLRLLIVLLAIVGENADQVEGVADQDGFNFLIERT